MDCMHVCRVSLQMVTKSLLCNPKIFRHFGTKNPETNQTASSCT